MTEEQQAHQRCLDAGIAAQQQNNVDLNEKRLKALEEEVKELRIQLINLESEFEFEKKRVYES